MTDDYPRARCRCAIHYPDGTLHPYSYGFVAPASESEKTMTDEPSNEYALWPDGMLQCEARSPVRRLALGSDNAFPQPATQAPLLDIHTQMIVEPLLLKRTTFDMRHEAERRLLYQLVEFGVKNHVWPTAPEIRWYKWSAAYGIWRRILWPPDDDPAK